MLLEKGILSTENAESLTNRLLFVGFLMRFSQENQNAARLNTLKSATIEIYINSLIDSRVKLKRWLVKCSNYWLRYATKDDFKEKLLVEVKRSLLRNPEIVLEGAANNPFSLIIADNIVHSVSLINYVLYSGWIFTRRFMYRL